jgi:hypothetical protein
MRREQFREQWESSRTKGNAMARSFEDDRTFGNNSSQTSTSEDNHSERLAATIDHDRARELIQEQTRRLLPPQEANALADHLLVCDRCYRYAQDVAHQERQSGKHSAVTREDFHAE